MRVFFGAQVVVDLINDGYTPITENATEAQKNVQREMRKNDHKALVYIHQCVDMKVFEKIVDSITTKAIWDTLVWCYGGDSLVKKVKL